MKYTATVLILASSLTLAACNSIQTPQATTTHSTYQEKTSSQIIQNQEGIKVTVADTEAKIIKTQAVLDQSPKIENWNIDLSKIEPIQNVTKDIQNDSMGKVSSQATRTLVKTQYDASEAFTKTYVNNRERRRIGPQQITITTSGEFNLSVSGEGLIRVVKVLGGGSIKVASGGTFSSSFYACRDYETKVTDRYIRFRQYNYYSDGTKVATGAYTDTRQPSQYGDTTTYPTGAWSIC